MTPNEKQLIDVLKKARKASAITLSKQIGLSYDYTQDICSSLEERGMLKVVKTGVWPVYSLKQKASKK